MNKSFSILAIMLFLNSQFLYAENSKKETACGSWLCVNVNGKDVSPQAKAALRTVADGISSAAKVIKDGVAELIEKGEVHYPNEEIEWSYP